MEKPDTNIDATFEELESLTTDPLLDKIFDKAREFEEMINSLGGVSEQDRMDLLAELNEMWPYRHENLLVSGRAQFLNEESEQLEYRSYNDELMVSDGFCSIKVGERDIDGEIIEQHKMAHHLLKPLNPEGTTLAGGVALIDEVAIEYPRKSVEMTETMLRYYHPDVMEELDCIILNCSNEEEATLGLKDFTINTKISEFDDIDYVSNLQTYLKSALEFDTELPYMMTFTGDCYVYDDNGRVCSALADDNVYGIAHIKSIQFLPVDFSIPHEQEQTLVPCIEVALFKPDKKSQPNQMYIPAASLRTLKSLRREAYE